MNPSPLDPLIALHRSLFRDELAISRMVSRQPPTTLDLNTGTLYSEPAAAVGMTVSGSLLRRIGHPEGYGMLYPWARSLWLLRVECRRKHPQHRSAERPYWRGALCHQAVKLVVVGGEAKGIGPLTAEQAASVLRLDKINPLLRGGLRFIEDQMDEFRVRAERRAKEDEGVATVCACGHGWPRHDHPGSGFACDAQDGCRRYRANGPDIAHHVPSDEHRVECPQCRRNAA